jgi:hypothetical protein
MKVHNFLQRSIPHFKQDSSLTESCLCNFDKRKPAWVSQYLTKTIYRCAVSIFDDLINLQNIYRFY